MTREKLPLPEPSQERFMDFDERWSAAEWKPRRLTIGVLRRLVSGAEPVQRGCDGGHHRARPLGQTTPFLLKEQT
jgi:hypothetical protein